VDLAERAGGLLKLTVALYLLSGMTGCKDDNSFAADKMPVPTKARPSGYEDVDTGVRPILDSVAPGSKPKPPAVDAPKQPAFTDADIKELRASLPKLEGELVLEALGVVAKSRAASLTVCLGKPLTEATSQVIQAYKETWNDIEVSTPPKNNKHRRLSANGKRFRMTATAVGGTTIGCPSPKTHTKVSFRFQERTPAGLPSTALKLDTAASMKKALSPRDPAAARRARGSESPPPAPQD
jgi:hypothetical protein